MCKRIMMVCFLLGLFSSVSAKSGDIDIKYTAIFAFSQKGGSHVDNVPQDKAYCFAHFGKLYQSEPITIHYSIDPVSLLQDVKVDFLTENALQLHPEGLTDRYYFLSDGVRSLQQHQVSQVFVFMDKALQLASTKIVFTTPYNYECVMVGVGPIS